MTSRLVRPLFAAALIALQTTLPAQAPANSGPRPIIPGPNSPLATSVGRAGDEMVDTFKLPDGDVDSVLHALEIQTGRSIIRPGQLPTASYSLVITRPIPKKELITALETLLALNQIAVTPMGDRFLKVVALAQAKNETPELITGSALDQPASGKIATKVFELNFLRVAEFVPQIQTMLTPGIGGGVVSLEKANVVMVTDSVANLQRIEQLLDQVDKPREGILSPKFYGPLQYAKASDVVTKIRAMLAGPAQNQLRATTTFNADDNTNQIIVIADRRELPLFDSLIEKLDTKSAPNTRTEVIYLKHADAKDVGTLLTQLITAQNAATQKASQGLHPGQIATTTPTVPGQPTPTPVAQPAAPSSTAAAAALGLENNGSSEFSSLCTVSPDERTNSVVVSGTIDDIRLVHDIVNKIDILLAQVRIQVVIAEVTLSDTDTTGVSALQLQFGTGPNGSSTKITGFGGTIGGWTATSSTGSGLGTVNPLAFLASLQSAGDKHSVKILQTDTIVTTHSKQAIIQVTEQQPIITGSQSSIATTGGVPVSSSTVTYKDIGVTLKVTPLIGDDGSIQLTIDQTVDNNEGTVVIDSNNQPIIGHREATSTVNVQDGQLVILGGLQSINHSLDRTKIGFIYEIPIISNLLGARNNDLERSELLLFLRPQVIKPENADKDAHDTIDGISNHEQINQYLKHPTAAPPDSETILEKLK